MRNSESALRGRAIELLPGQYFDRETGLAHNGARDYDPPTGRYIQPDPVGLLSDISLYSYGVNNPLTNTDPSGMFILIYFPGGDDLGGSLLITRPPKVAGMFACNARCPVNPIGTTCPPPDCPKYVEGHGIGPSLGDAIDRSKSDANSKIPKGCQAKHCTYKCTGPKGDPFYPRPG